MDPLVENILWFVVQFQKSQPDLVARSHLQVRSHLHPFALVDITGQQSCFFCYLISIVTVVLDPFNQRGSVFDYF